ncbi:kinesin-like protein Nod [Toxorhynchites rutilus septentrionalis]|uniref:kinesin-like protein Nod n=1 Tax=Toxorhynchites rutilus septentrionalis TaxID=329112 RepID=UPI00247AFA61|nr:kinesin-like protein Nod [Toxorhynchites rutilus septentrionalis]XP_055615678.1 kinesin-like protein Nod [Toxorhynchites rutilus septentrionalis]
MKLVTDASCDSLEPVRIAIRERPAGGKCAESIITHHSANDQILIVDERPFAFDYVFRPGSTQASVYDALIRPLVVKMINGFYCTALAYGQTGTGKTFTMGLQWDHSGPHDINRGMITRALDQTFDLLEESRNKEDYEIQVSFIEIYNEKIYDLLSENSTEPVNTRGCKFNGGTKRLVTRAGQAQDILIEGNKNRHVRPTKMNTLSSRSHAIFSIHASVVHDDVKIVSALHLVDLAGSEGVRRTGHQGVAMTEGVHINQGLLSIGKVLQALSIGSKVIPYRDSVLSAVLQDSLNSNSYLTLLACVSPAQEDLSETLSTIRFAQGAKTLKNNPQINAITAELKAKERTRTPGKSYVPGASALKARNLNPKTPKSAAKRPRIPDGSSAKKVHSNTFCTPSKIRKLDYGKLNSTVAPVPLNKAPPNTTDAPLLPPGAPAEKSAVIIAPPTKAALQSAQLMMPPPPVFPRFSDVTERDFECIPADSRSSMFSLNLSSSTSVDQPASTSSSVVSQSSTYSPIVKKCMETFEATIEQKLAQMFERIQHMQQPVMAPPTPSLALPVVPKTNSFTSDDPVVVDCSIQPDSSSIQASATPAATTIAPIDAGSIPWEMIRKEIQDAIRCEMSTVNESYMSKFESTPCHQKQSTNSRSTVRAMNPLLKRLKEQSRVAADDSLGEGGLDSTVVMNTKTPRRWEVINVDSDEEAGDESLVVVRRKQTKAFSVKRQPFGEIINECITHPTPAAKNVQIATDESYLWDVQNGQARRRSTRISLRIQQKKVCCQSAKKKQRFEALVEDEKENVVSKPSRKAKNALTISNKVIAGYFQTPGGSKKDPKMTANKHGKAVLDLVNRGSIKEVRILPTVGLKMAYQIVTHRTINGKFKKIDDLAKLFVGGKKWTKFLEANYLS